MSTATKIRPFANGSEYHDWLSVNCERCPLAFNREDRYQCAVEAALDSALWGDGTISAEIAAQMGCTDETMLMLAWPCKERLLAEANGGALPLDVALRRSGAAELPGIDRR